MSTRFPLMALGHGCDLQPEAPAAGIDADTHREVGMGRLIVSAAAHAQPGRFRFQHVAGTFHATSSNCRSTRGPLLSTWFA